jgi:dGTP triphosphohydrolase
MGLNIILSNHEQAPERAALDSKNSISFEGGGADYWYLWPTMIQEIENKTGKLMDLYDDIEFSGEDLEKLEKIVLKQIEELKHKKEGEWEVSVGTQLQPVKKEILRIVIKQEIVNKLKKFLSIILKAKKTNAKVLCIGD